MSDIENPWKSPEAEIAPVASLAPHGALTEGMLGYLSGASPWLRFIGIMSFIGCGLIILLGVVFLGIGPFIAGAFDELFDGFNMGGFAGGLIGGIYIILGAVCLLPAKFIYSFGAKIRSYRSSGAEQDLEAAFKNNKSLWKFLGILTIIEIALVPVMIIGSIIAAFATMIF
jgi:hypothetical protein